MTLMAMIYFAGTLCVGTLLGARPTGIRTWDFKNWIYFVPDLPDEAPGFRHLGIYEKGTQLHLRNGEYHSDLGGGDWTYVKLTSLTYGDVTGDGQEEAIVSLILKAGGTQSRGLVLAFAISGSVPRLIDAFWTGDRANGGLHRTRIENKQLIIETYVPDGTDGFCCPKQISETRFSFSDGQFRETPRIDDSVHRIR